MKTKILLKKLGPPIVVLASLVLGTSQSQIRLCRALICAVGLAVVATAANAQTSVLAYRSDSVYGPLDCEAGCYWDVYSVVIPAGVVGYQPTWSPDGARLAFTDGYDIFVIPATGGN